MKTLTTLILSTALLASCEHPGTCQSRYAVNYKGDDGSPSAKTGPCYYEDLPFSVWKDYASALALREANNNVDFMLDYYVDDEYIGSEWNNTFWGEGPPCDSEGAVWGTIDIDNEGNSYKDVHVVVKDTSGTVWVDGMFTAQILGDGCVNVQYKYEDINFNL